MDAIRVVEANDYVRESVCAPFTETCPDWKRLFEENPTSIVSTFSREKT